MDAGLGYIYSLNCPTTGDPKYIGKTSQSLERRLNAHLTNYKINKRSNWIKSLKSQGLKPTMEVIDNVPNNEIDFWERHYISLYNSWGFNLKNMTEGGDGGRQSLEARNKISLSRKGKPMSEETRRKLSLSKKGKPQPNRQGKPLSEEHKRKVSLSLIGRNVSEETRRKMSIATKGKKKNYPAPFKGKKHSEEVRKKMSLALMGRVSHNKGKRLSAETVAKMSRAMKGRVSWNKGMRGVYSMPPRLPISEETRAKMKIAAKIRASKRDISGKNNPMFEKPAWNKGMRFEGRKGFKHSDEVKLKISLSKIGKKAWNAGFKLVNGKYIKPSDIVLNKNK